MRRVLLVATAAAVGWAAVATPARADSAGPTNYRSEVTEVTPPTEAVDVRIVGGDSFIAVTAAEGVTVDVPGYGGEPFVRIEADGTVLVNHNSQSFWINQDRFGRGEIPPNATDDAEPDWQRVAGNGSYGWHDHRIHWMSPDPPPAVDRTTESLVHEWKLTLVVNGDEVTVFGELWWVPAVSPFPWLLVVAAAAALFIRVPALLALGVVPALAVGGAQALTSPLGPGAEVLTWAPPLLALASVVGARFSRRLLALGAVLLTVWVLLRLPTLWMPVLPSGLGLERILYAVSAGTAVAALVVAWRQLLADLR